MWKIYKTGRAISDAKIATDSLAIVSDDLVSLSGGFVVKATDSTGAIEGVSKTNKTFSATNESVEKEKVIVVNDSDLRLKLTADAAITEANVGSYFTINADQTVDVATLSATAGQLRLEEVYSDTVGIFSIV